MHLIPYLACWSNNMWRFFPPTHFGFSNCRCISTECMGKKHTALAKGLRVESRSEKKTTKPRSRESSSRTWWYASTELRQFVYYPYDKKTEADVFSSNLNGVPSQQLLGCTHTDYFSISHHLQSNACLAIWDWPFANLKDHPIEVVPTRGQPSFPLGSSLFLVDRQNKSHEESYLLSKLVCTRSLAEWLKTWNKTRGGGSDWPQHQQNPLWTD